MLSRDLIATVIKTFFQELDDVRDGGKHEVCESPYNGFYRLYFDRDRAWFIQASGAEITTFLADDPIHKLEMLAELMYRDAKGLTETRVQGVMFRKIIELYEAIDIRSQEFSMSRMSRGAELKSLID